MKELNLKEIMPRLDKAMDETAQKMAEVHGPYWNSRLDVSKVVLTITAAVLIGTISFSSSLIGPSKVGLVYPCVLFASWGLFVISGISSLYAMWNLYKLNAHHILLINRQPMIEQELNNIGLKDSPEELKKELDQTILSITTKTLTPLKSCDQNSHYALAVQLLSFAVSLLMFMIFGVLQIV
jgi:hypothetical protein